MQFLIPIAGRSPFFPSSEFFFPKSLLEVAGRPMIEHVIKNLSSIEKNSHFIFVVQGDDVRRFSIDRTLQLLTEGRANIIQLRGETRGALCSALMAVDVIDPSMPLIVSNGDQIIDDDLEAFVKRFRTAAVQAGVVTFDSVHPRWSYVEVGEDGYVREAAEKRVISRHAIAGFYYFDTGRRFLDAAMKCIENNASVEGQFYTAPCLNEVILDGGYVASVSVDPDRYHSFHTPEMISRYEATLGGGLACPVDNAARPRVRVVIPAAGQGSRFRSAGYAKPKPFIDVLGRPMIMHVINNISPVGADVHLLFREEHITAEAALINDLKHKGITIHEVVKVTEGTACTLLLARESIDDETPLLVANSDQFVDFSVDDFFADCISRDLDGSILVFREPSKDSKWSYAKLDDNELVSLVAEKVAISDLATVGVYLFRRGSDFVRGAIDMISRNERVNNEFYTCPVYNYLISKGLRIGVYEVPRAAMHGLGTPEDLGQFVNNRTSG